MNGPSADDWASVNRTLNISNAMTIGNSHHCFFFQRKRSSSLIEASLELVWSLFTVKFLKFSVGQN